MQVDQESALVRPVSMSFTKAECGLHPNDAGAKLRFSQRESAACSLQITAGKLQLAEVYLVNIRQQLPLAKSTQFI
jgi:hypothetical protein